MSKPTRGARGAVGEKPFFELGDALLGWWVTTGKKGVYRFGHNGNIMPETHQVKKYVTPQPRLLILEHQILKSAADKVRLGAQNALQAAVVSSAQLASIWPPKVQTIIANTQLPRRGLKSASFAHLLVSIQNRLERGAREFKGLLQHPRCTSIKALVVSGRWYLEYV